MIYVLLAALFYGVTIVLAAAASRRMDTNLVAGLTQLISGFIPLVLFISLSAKRSAVHASRSGILFAIAAALTLSVFVMALNKSYTLNKIGIVTPIVFGGAIFLSTIASYFVFKEKVTGIEALGLLLIGLGFAVIIYARATS